jgi:cell division FtsZ-interacting protein ZapD
VLNHSAVTCNAYDILKIFKQATLETRYTIQAIAGTLGVPQAEVNSHFEVAMNAIDLVWRRRSSGVDARYVAGQILQNIIRNRPADRDRVLALARQRMSRLPGGAAYFDRLKVGDFILDAPLLPAAKRRQIS